MKKVELLAPAGNYESFLAAISAGADAVYLGGGRFGARAYAENFTQEELCQAIRYAHLFDRKVYLTVNTVLKTDEIEEVPRFLLPLYLEGLDAVIIQDIGMLDLIRKEFPLLEIHISTQMAVTGRYGIRFLKSLGASRVVPARELSLPELKAMKEEGAEVESFIHGAMCYSYSGQCLFSSFLGGRSGNRGKCAGTCRLPYKICLADKGEERKSGKKRQSREEYPLSLKDMCTIELLPELMEAGIDSFKIEGRMKRPEYVAGVVSVYRRYRDMYMEHPVEPYHVEEEDLKLLKSLYIRTQIQEGYYYKRNGRDMVTLEHPGYRSMDDKLQKQIHEAYQVSIPRLEATGEICLKEGSPALFTLTAKGKSVTVSGEIPQQAKKRPLSAADVEKQLSKTGNTAFELKALTVTMEGDLFLPLQKLNELRREAFFRLEETVTEEIRAKRLASLPEKGSKKETAPSSALGKSSGGKAIHVAVTTKEQCLAVCGLEMDRLYVHGDLFLTPDAELIKRLTEYAKNHAVWVTLPEIVRQEDLPLLDLVLKNSSGFASGVLISNLETYGYLNAVSYSKGIALHNHMYVINRESMLFWESRADSISASPEGSFRDWSLLTSPKMEYMCYGRIPVMVTANCIRKTHVGCRKHGITLDDCLIDRYQKRLPVQINCHHCLNIIYNAVPLSLHGYLEQIDTLPGGSLRLEFTCETGEDAKRILREYLLRQHGKEFDFSFLREFTTGHYKKGAL
ncbi:MAG: U32 family peptidase [Lachnospiraceae bacterium]|nr:U32 family peptidase [Lachnospiraceae bacterium]